MSANYILIDLENVQPNNLSLLIGHPFQIYVFVGENQAKIPFDLASTMQQFGENAKYIKISGNGKNASDFHLAFYLGKLATADADGCYHIISKDTGFDPLVKHLRKDKIRIFRHTDITEIPILRISTAKNMNEKIEAVVKNLIGRGQSRPRKVSTLSNTINSIFTEKFNEAEMSSFINALVSKKYISIEQDKVSYNLQR